MYFGSALLSFLILPLAVLGHSPRGDVHTRHHQLAKRAAGEVELHKRFSAARWTFYDVGLGACGKTNGPNDFIVALNSAQYGGGYPGPHCFQTITMTYNGKTTTATIMDECPGCPYGGLDLSRGLFTFFAPESVGVLYGEWSFGNGAPAPAPKPTTTKEAPPPPPKTTSTKEEPTTTWKPEPTTTWKPEPTTTWKPEPTTTSKPEPKTSSTKTTFSSSSSSTHSSSSSSSTSSDSVMSSSTVSSSKTSVTPAPSGSQQPLLNLQAVENVFGALGGIVLAGASA